MHHMSFDLVNVIHNDRLERVRRARLGSAARRRRGFLERFSLRDALGMQSRENTEPVCVPCPIPSR
jgi:hypothetical protein